MGVWWCELPDHVVVVSCPESEGCEFNSKEKAYDYGGTAHALWRKMCNPTCSGVGIMCSTLAKRRGQRPPRVEGRMVVRSMRY